MNIYNHLEERHLDLKLYEQSVVVCDSNNVATFMMSDLGGTKLNGYQRYNPLGNKIRKNLEDSGRYFTHTPSKVMSVWGLEFQSTLLSKTMVIVEGVFKACRLHKTGINAIAVTGNNPKFAREEFLAFGLQYDTIVIPDPDKAGRLLIKYGNRHIDVSEPLDELNEVEFTKLTKEILNNDNY